MKIKNTIILIMLLLPAVSLSAYEINSGTTKIFIKSSYKDANYWVNPAKDRDNDVSLIRSLSAIFKAYQSSDISSYQQYTATADDLKGLDVGPKTILKLKQKKKRMIQSFTHTLNSLKEAGINIKKAVFVGVKRENIETKGNLAAIRKVYLVFKEGNKAHSLYLRTFVKSKNAVWKMTKESSLVKPRTKKVTDLKMCSQEAKQCGDGSYVSRNNANDCEFNDCP